MVCKVEEFVGILHINSVSTNSVHDCTNRGCLPYCFANKHNKKISGISYTDGHKIHLYVDY